MRLPSCLLISILLQMFAQAASGQFNAEPLFIANAGQVLNQHGEVNKAVHYQLALGNCNVLLRQSGFSYDTWQRDAEGALRFHRIDVDFAKANRPHVEPVGGETVNFCYDDQRCIQTMGYAAVVYRDLYPQIDVVFRLNADAEGGRQFEYDVLVGEGACIEDVVLTYSGMNALDVHDQRIELSTQFGQMHETMPLAYLSDSGEALDVRYTSLSNNQVGFIDYSGQLGLCAAIIDPVTTVEWSTYYGNTDGSSIRLLEVLPSGDFIAGGSTEATTGIATEGAYQVNLTGPFLPPFSDFTPSCFLVRFNSAGQRIWGTYFGGERIENESGISVYEDKLVLVGGASSTSAIATESGWLSESQGVGQNFVACFNLDGTLNWSTYVYGSPNKDPSTNNVSISDVCTSVGGVTIAGSSQQVMPVTEGFEAVPHSLGGWNGYMLRLSWEGELEWCRYMGQDGGSMALLAEGDEVLAVGITRDSSMATANAPLSELIGEPGHFFARIGSDGQIEFLTYLVTAGESLSWEGITGLLNSGEAYYYCGITRRSGMAVGDVHQTEYPSTSNAPIIILTKVDANTHEVVWRTYYGGEGEDFCEDIVELPDGSLCVVGFTRGNEGLATEGALEESTMGSYNSGLIASFSNSGQLISATYLGGEESTIVYSIELIDNDILVGGLTLNPNFGTAGAHEPFFGVPIPKSFITRFSTVTGVNELGHRVVQCYPNPAVQRINLTYGDGHCTHVRVYNATGGQVIDRQCSAKTGTLEIDVSNLASGRYTVVINTQEGQIARGSFLRIAP